MPLNVGSRSKQTEPGDLWHVVIREFGTVAKLGVTVHIEASLVSPNTRKCIDEHKVLLGVIVKLRKSPGFALFNGDVLLAHDQHRTEDMFCEMVRHWTPHAGEAASDRHTTLDITQRAYGCSCDFRERPHPFKSFRKNPHAILCSSNCAPSATCGIALAGDRRRCWEGDDTRIMDCMAA